MLGIRAVDDLPRRRRLVGRLDTALERPLDFACAVALSARFGFDLDLDSLSDEELAVCRGAVELARRTQDLVQLGRLQRLHSPVEGDDRSRAALAYRSEDQDRVVVFAYQLDTPPESHPEGPVLRLGDLSPEVTYRVVRESLVDEPSEEQRLTGAALAGAGLKWPLDEACTAAIWTISPA